MMYSPQVCRGACVSRRRVRSTCFLPRRLGQLLVSATLARPRIWSRAPRLAGVSQSSWGEWRPLGTCARGGHPTRGPAAPRHRSARQWGAAWSAPSLRPHHGAACLPACGPCVARQPAGAARAGGQQAGGQLRRGAGAGRRVRQPGRLLVQGPHARRAHHVQSAYTDPLGNTCGLRCALLQRLAETRPQVAPDRTASAAEAASASARSSAPATAAASGRTQSGLIDCRCSLRSRPPATPARQAPAARVPRDKLPLVCSACACQRATSACASCCVALDSIVLCMPAHATRSLRAACVRQACA